MGDCIDPATVYEFATKDTNRIKGQIAKVMATRSPYVDILDGGTVPANFSEVVRSVVQEPAVVHSSLVEPVFVDDVTLCGADGGEDKVGSKEYQYKLQALRGKGPRVCVKTMYNAFKGAYAAAQQSLTQAVMKITNADVRSLLYKRSGLKFVAKTGVAFGDLLTGNVQNIDQAFYPANPDSSMTFKSLLRIGRVMYEEFMVEPWTVDRGTMWKVIAGSDQIEKFRNEVDVKEDLLALTKGRYKIGEESIDSFIFQGPYRGFGFAVDPQPLRSTGIITSGPNAGKFTLVEPEISVATTNGFASRRNPDWVSAPYEVGFIVGKESFMREVPENYTGEGTFKFNPQLAMGELEWHYKVDNDCNVWGDFGWHKYQIIRAYRPVRPHAILAFIYKRCDFDTGFATCVSSGSGL